MAPAKERVEAEAVQVPARRRAGGPPVDSTLVELALQGRQDAFRDLFERYRQRVYRIAYGWCYQKQTALDLVQDVFVKAFRSLGKFRKESSFWTWLCRITINRCLDYIRKKSRSKEIPVEEPAEVAPAAGANSANPAQQAQLNELQRALAGALRQLSPQARAAFTLRFYDQLSYREIAEALDCSIGTVMSRLFYARQKLRELLEDYL